MTCPPRVRQSGSSVKAGLADCVGVPPGGGEDVAAGIVSVGVRVPPDLVLMSGVFCGEQSLESSNINRPVNV